MILGTSLGIEVAGKDLRIAVVRAAFGKLRLVQAGEIAEFADLTLEDQKAALAQKLKDLRISASRVYLSLPRDKGIVRQLEFPLEIRDKLKSAVALQLETLSPWGADEVYWDFSYTTPKGANSIPVTVSMIPHAALDPWIEFFRSVGLPLSGASLSPLTWAHGVGVLWPAYTSPTVVLDCESGHVEASVVQRDRVSSLGHSGEDISSTARTAVERLMAIGRIAPADTLRLLVYGPGSSSIEWRERIQLPLENSAPDSSERFGAICAALSSMRNAAFGSNLIPVAIRHRRNQVQLIPTYALILFAALLGLGMLAREPYQLMVYAGQIDEEIRRVAPSAREVAKQQSELNVLSERYRALSVNLQSRDYNLEALREFARVLPSTAWLSNYNYQDGNITASVFAESASEIQKLLEDSPLFKSVQFSSVIREKNKDRFTLRASIEVRQ